MKLKRLKGTSKATHDFAYRNNRRPFVFNMVFKDGSSVSSEGSVLPEDCKRLAEIFRELVELSRK